MCIRFLLTLLSFLFTLIYPSPLSSSLLLMPHADKTSTSRHVCVSKWVSVCVCVVKTSILMRKCPKGLSHVNVGWWGESNLNGAHSCRGGMKPEHRHTHKRSLSLSDGKSYHLTPIEAYGPFQRPALLQRGWNYQMSWTSTERRRSLPFFSFSFFFCNLPSISLRGQ